MNRKNLWVILILVVFVEVVSAKTETLDSYVEKLAKHPQVTQILEQSIHFKELAYSEMSLPDPQVIIGVDNVPVDHPVFDRFLPSSKVIGFRQQIPSYSFRKAKAVKQEILSELQQLVAAYTYKRLKAILIGQLFELDRVNKLTKLAKKQLSCFRSIEIDLKGQLESGKPVYGRLSEIDVECIEIEQRLNNLNAERVAIQEELIRLVGEVPEVPLPIVAKAIWHCDEDILYPIKIASENVKLAKKSVDVADASFYPNYGIQAVYKKRESGRNFSGEDWFSIQATISIPLWSKSNQKPKLRAAEANKRSTVYAYESTKRDWIKYMVALKAERDSAFDNIGLLQRKKMAIRKIVEAAEHTYESGNTPVEMVLDAQINELNITAHLIAQYSRYIQLSTQFNSHIMR